MSVTKYNVSKSVAGRFLAVRHLISFLVFFGCAVGYLMRANMSIAVVAMTDHESNSTFSTFDWSLKQTSLILSSFSWGYVVTQIPSGVLARYYGAKWVFFTGMFVSSVAAVLTPLAAVHGGVPSVCTLRVIQGLSQAVQTPCIHAVGSKWVPVNERARTIALNFTGGVVGTIISWFISGYLAASSGGWPSIFYVSGTVGFVWCLLWVILSSSSPQSHYFISTSEVDLIQTSLGEHDSKLATPWRNILSSKPVWSVVIAQCCHGWGFWTLLSLLPRYMKSVLKFDIKSNGVMSSLPYVCKGILAQVFGCLSDWIVSRQYLSTTATRKLFNTIAMWGPAIGLLIVSYIPADQSTLAVACLTILVGLSGGIYVSIFVSPMDLSPNFASSIVSISNCAATGVSIAVPLVGAALLSEESTYIEWRRVFWLSSGAYFFGNIIYLAFCSGVLQPWNDPPTNAKDGKSVVQLETNKSELQF